MLLRILQIDEDPACVIGVASVWHWDDLGMWDLGTTYDLVGAWDYLDLGMTSWDDLDLRTTWWDLGTTWWDLGTTWWENLDLGTTLGDLWTTSLDLDLENGGTLGRPGPWDDLVLRDSASPKEEKKKHYISSPVAVALVLPQIFFILPHPLPWPCASGPHFI